MPAIEPEGEVVELPVGAFHKGDIVGFVRAEEKRSEQLLALRISDDTLAHTEAEHPYKKVGVGRHALGGHKEMIQSRRRDTSLLGRPGIRVERPHARAALLSLSIEFEHVLR